MILIVQLLVGIDILYVLGLSYMQSSIRLNSLQPEETYNLFSVWLTTLARRASKTASACVGGPW